jgi:hypothetical protein
MGADAENRERHPRISYVVFGGAPLLSAREIIRGFCQ